MVTCGNRTKKWRHLPYQSTNWTAVLDRNENIYIIRKRIVYHSETQWASSQANKHNLHLKRSSNNTFLHWELCTISGDVNITDASLKNRSVEIKDKHYSINYLFPTCIRIPTHLQQTTFENIVTKEEIAQDVQFLLLPQCFSLLVIGYPFNYRDFLFFDKKSSKSSAAELSYEGKG